MKTENQFRVHTGPGEEQLGLVVDLIRSVDGLSDPHTGTEHVYFWAAGEPLELIGVGSPLKAYFKRMPGFSPGLERLPKTREVKTAVILPPTLTIVNDEGTPFIVALVHPGERYGRISKHGVPACLNDGKHTLVEFWDASQDAETFGPMGQFVSRYRAETLIEATDGHDGQGLDLLSHVPAWYVDGRAMIMVRRWIRLMTGVS